MSVSFLATFSSNFFFAATADKKYKQIFTEKNHVYQQCKKGFPSLSALEIPHRDGECSFSIHRCFIVFLKFLGNIETEHLLELG